MQGLKKDPGAMRRTGETANGRTGEARIRTAGSMDLGVCCVTANGLDDAVSPPRPFAVSPTRLCSWLLFLDEHALV